MDQVTRRHCLQVAAATPLALTTSVSSASLCPKERIADLITTQEQAEGYYRLGKANRKTWLMSPDNLLFFSIGFNHIDPAALRQPENTHLR